MCALLCVFVYVVCTVFAWKCVSAAQVWIARTQILHGCVGFEVCVARVLEAVQASPRSGRPHQGRRPNPKSRKSPNRLCSRAFSSGAHHPTRASPPLWLCAAPRPSPHCLAYRSSPHSSSRLPRSPERNPERSAKACVLQVLQAFQATQQQASAGPHEAKRVCRAGNQCHPSTVLPARRQTRTET